MSEYNIAVLGPIPKDHITTHHGEVIEKYGCAMHTTIGVSRLLGNLGQVIPVSHLRSVDETPVKSILKPYENVVLEHITSHADKGDIIQLEFLDQNNRREKQTGFMNPIVPADLKDLMHCDVFVCVPITDYEVPLETLKFIKENSDATIIFDAHGPTTTVNEAGDRQLKLWMDRDEWLPYIDVLKMNLEESACSWFETHEGEIGSVSTDLSYLRDFAEHSLDLGLDALIVTLDERGSALFFKQAGEVVEEMVDAMRVEEVIDTTGCGDSFAGGLGFGLLGNSQAFHKAIKYANALGAQRTQGKTFEVFKSKDVTDRMIIDHYGEL